MSDDHVLIRPGINAARGEYDRRRVAELKHERAQLRADQLKPHNASSTSSTSRSQGSARSGHASSPSTSPATASTPAASSRYRCRQHADTEAELTSTRWHEHEQRKRPTAAGSFASSRRVSQSDEPLPTAADADPVEKPRQKRRCAPGTSRVRP